MNKADTNARGHLGAELVNKCEAVIMVRKESKELSIIEPGDTRESEFRPLIMKITDNVPVIEGYYEAQEPTKTEIYKQKTPF